jgi:hypothetical protein
MGFSTMFVETERVTVYRMKAATEAWAAEKNT